MMLGRLWILAVCFVPMGCQHITYDHTQSITEPAPESIQGVQVPEFRPAREPYTTYYEVTSSEGVAGYVVRFDEVPYGVRIKERSAPAGSMFVEDAEFVRIGFITAEGKAYRFRNAHPDVIGQGDLDLVLPLYFDAPGLDWRPLVSD